MGRGGGGGRGWGCAMCVGRRGSGGDDAGDRGAVACAIFSADQDAAPLRHGGLRRRGAGEGR